MNDQYRNKITLAPMVRIGILPTRLLALDYGADLVFSEEIIDHKLIKCRRLENKLLGTVDFVLADNSVIFQTCNKESGKVILQLGTSDSSRALKAAQLVEKDVAGIDINMCCPKKFSISGGMGAALLTNPLKVKEILSTLVEQLTIPVTCKMRVLPTIEDTVKLAKLIESTGVKAVSIHGRTKYERPSDKNRVDFIRAAADALSIPVIASGGSGDIKHHSDIEIFKSATNASSVMIARAAQRDPSIFSAGPRSSLISVVQNFLHYMVKYETPCLHGRYCIQTMEDCLQTEQGQATLQCYTLFDLCKVWGMERLYSDTMRKRKMDANNCPNTEPDIKHLKLPYNIVLNSTVITLPCVFQNHLNYEHSSPKQILREWALMKNKDLPLYNTVFNLEYKRFKCILVFDGLTYTAPIWGKSKQIVEQSAAMVCLESLGLDYGPKTPKPLLMENNEYFLNSASDSLDMNHPILTSNLS